MIQATVYFLVLMGFIAFPEINSKTVTPIIGVLTQESPVSSDLQEMSGLYTNYVQASGGRVVPVFIDRDNDYYETIFNSINGIIFPGSWGDLLDIFTDYFPKSGYYKAGKIMYNLALNANERGDYFPVFGFCQGFQLITYLAAKDKNIFKKCNAIDIASTLDFTKNSANLKKTKIFRDASYDTIQDLQFKKISYQSHNNCLTIANYTKERIGAQFDILATNIDKSNLRFITIMEHRMYPIYALFNHAEEIIGGFNGEKCKNIPKSKSAVLNAQFFSRFVVNEARNSKHTFDNENLIYKYTPTYTPHSADCSPITYYFPFKSSNIPE